MKREATKEIVIGGIGMAISLLTTLLIRKAKLSDRIDAYYDAQDAKKED